GAVLARIVGAAHLEVAGLDLDAHAERQLALELALRPLDRHVAAREVHVDPLRHRNGLATDARHYQTSQINSPPTPALRAARSVMMPCDVVRSEIPMPERTFGIASLFTYL